MAKSSTLARRRSNEMPGVCLEKIVHSSYVQRSYACGVWPDESFRPVSCRAVVNNGKAYTFYIPLQRGNRPAINERPFANSRGLLYGALSWASDS